MRWRRAAGRLAARFGAVDVLVGNAGVVSGKRLADLSPDEIERTLRVNTAALFWTARALRARHDRARLGAHRHDGLGGRPGRRSRAFRLLRLQVRCGRLPRIAPRRTPPRCSGVGTTLICPFFVDTGMFAGVRTRFPRPPADPRPGRGRRRGRPRPSSGTGRWSSSPGSSIRSSCSASSRPPGWTPSRPSSASTPRWRPSPADRGRREVPPDHPPLRFRSGAGLAAGLLNPVPRFRFRSGAKNRCRSAGGKWLEGKGVRYFQVTSMAKKWSNTSRSGWLASLRSGLRM